MSFEKPEQGNVRETFLVNQVNVLNKINTSAQGDFLINGKYTVEVSGKGKKFNK